MRHDHFCCGILGSKTSQQWNWHKARQNQERKATKRMYKTTQRQRRKTTTSPMVKILSNHEQDNGKDKDWMHTFGPTHCSGPTWVSSLRLFQTLLRRSIPWVGGQVHPRGSKNLIRHRLSVVAIIVYAHPLSTFLYPAWNEYMTTYGNKKKICQQLATKRIHDTK